MFLFKADPAGGAEVFILPNGNYLIVDPDYDLPGPISNVGAVHLHQGNNGARLTSLVGSTAGDAVGSGGITLVGTNYYLVKSPNWANGPAAKAGAISWGLVNQGINGAVSAANSLIGSSTGDTVGSGVITKFGNDYYLVSSPNWANGSAAKAGAVSWGFQTQGIKGVVSAANSLIGSSAGDTVGSGGITKFGNDYYLVSSPNWANGPAAKAGAVSWGFQTQGIKGLVSAANSLIGSSAGDTVGSGGITTFGNNYYLVSSPNWANGPAAKAGAVSWGFQTQGIKGAVSASNSLVGSHPGDVAGSGGISQPNSNSYLVNSPNWLYGAGAVTWGAVNTGAKGVISASNSSVGFSTAVPEIAVFQPQTTNLATGSTRAFGSCPVGSAVSLTFRVSNVGTDDLLLTGSPRINISGAEAGSFYANDPSTSLIVTSDSIEFSVQFSPSSGGPKSASLSIPNNDADENPFQIQLEGIGTATLSEWRTFYFGSATNSGNGANLNDQDRDGVVNLVEYAFSLNPTVPNDQPFPVATRIGGDLVISFRGVAGIDYGAEWSNSLLMNEWQPVANSLTPPDYRFSVALDPNKGVFMRLKVSPLQ
jgi:hypothetical protein